MANKYRVDKRSQGRDFEAEERVFEGFLRRRGLKFTSVRRQLLRKIFDMKDHFTAEQLLERLKSADVRVSKATVYRTLAVMLECDLLRSHDFGEGSLFYEHSYGHGHHDHLFCVSCKVIIEFRDDRIEELQKRAAQEFGFRMLSHTLKIYGLCRQCAVDPEVRARFDSSLGEVAHRS